MADANQAQQQAASPSSITGTPFAQMSGAEKIFWLGKVVVMLFTGGFAFPNIFVE